MQFELKIIKTTGDKLQTASMAQPNASLPKGLFTKELEVALLEHQADLAVHSLKDLPTDLPAGLHLGAVGRRVDVRDVLIYRDAQFLKKAPALDWSPGQPERRGFPPHLKLARLPTGAVIATSSTRRKAQLLLARRDLKIVEIRGNVATRLQKLATQAELDATVLALAGISRLQFQITRGGQLLGEGVPDGLLAILLDTEVMLPCVGQGAAGIEVREHDARMAPICAALNHAASLQCVTAERAFLQAMGGGCQSPVAAYAQMVRDKLQMRVVSFRDGPVRRAAGKAAAKDADALGRQLAQEVK